MTRRPEIPVRFGFSIDHIERLARIATKRAFGDGLDPDERYSTAWHAIVVTLYESTDPPSSQALIRAGGRAILQAQEQQQAYLGYNQRDPWAGSLASARFQKYWNRGAAPSPEDCIDYIAVTQIWPCLTHIQQQAILLLATLEGYAEAAAAAGQTYSTYCRRLGLARTAFLKLWHEHETPSKPRRDQRIPSRR